MFNIDDVKALCHDDTIMSTKHFRDRRSERGIRYSDVIKAISTGEIIECYPDSVPYPSALISDEADGNKIHTVVGIGSGLLWFVTVYRPTLDRWENDYKTRKVVDSK